MSKKFVPNGDLDFLTMAEAFARTVARDPARCAVSAEDAGALGEAVAKYRAALQAARFGARSVVATEAKEMARGEAESLVRRLANTARVAKGVDRLAKFELGLRPREARPKQVMCPQEPPRLEFVRALHERSATPMHELKFSALDRSKSEPEGAVRLELFVGLAPPDGAIPAHPGPAYGASGGFGGWYLRSFTRGPIVLEPPMARVPMRVVYWGRWAGAAGDVGLFSATVVGWIEGGSRAFLPGAPAMVHSGLGGRKPVELIEDAGPRTLPPPAPAPAPEGERERMYVVAVLEAQVRALAPPEAAAPVEVPALPRLSQGEDGRRMLEGPAAAAAREAA